MNYNTHIFGSRVSSGSIETRLWAGGPGFDSRKGKYFFLFTTASRPALGPPRALPNGYQGFFPGGRAAGAWSWPLTSI